MKPHFEFRIRCGSLSLVKVTPFSLPGLLATTSPAAILALVVAILPSLFLRAAMAAGQDAVGAGWTYTVTNAGVDAVNGIFYPRNPTAIPAGFAKTCDEMGWASDKMWLRLSDQLRPWWESDNGSYLYWNQADGKWWLDGPSGAGVYIVLDSSQTPPADGWQPLPGALLPLPQVERTAAGKGAAGEL